MTRQFLSLPLLVLSSTLLLSSCGILSLNSSVNEPAPAERGTEPEFGNYQFSGAFVASDQVPWQVSAECRDAFDPGIITQLGEGKSSPYSGLVEYADANGVWPGSNEFWEAYCKLQGMEKDKDFIALALSGGGMRAAVFSSAVMFELQRYGIMRHVDVISSVSGGSIAAALYALSCDDRKDCPPTVEGPERCLWLAEGEDILQCGDGIFDLLDKNLELAWIGNLFWPDNVIRYWFTDWDRSDIMAETMADSLFDNSLWGGEGFLFRDFNPRRPSLVINATNITNDDTVSLLNERPSVYLGGYVDRNSDLNVRKEVLDRLQNHLNFRFTDFNFGKNEYGVCSDLHGYPVSNAVMASSAFPVVFQSVTLTDHCERECKEENGVVKKGTGCKYKHLFDGGNSDNLGLLGLKAVIETSTLGILPSHIVIIQVDATLGLAGRPEFESDPRSWVDFFIETNVIDTTDTLMATQYLNTEKEIDDRIKGLVIRGSKSNDAIRIHLSFRKLHKMGAALRREGEKNNNDEQIKLGKISRSCGRKSGRSGPG